MVGIQNVLAGPSASNPLNINFCGLYTGITIIYICFPLKNCQAKSLILTVLIYTFNLSKALVFLQHKFQS